MRGVRGLTIHRAPHSGHAATATAHVRAQLTTHAMLQPSSVLKGSGSRAHEPPDDSKDHAPQALDRRIMDCHLHP